MAKVLIVYSTFDGQTARIAQRMAGDLREAGLEVTLHPAWALDAPWEIDAHDAVVVGGAVRFGHHARALADPLFERSRRASPAPCATRTTTRCCAW